LLNFLKFLFYYNKMASNTTVNANRVNANETHSNNLMLNGGISGNYISFLYKLETNLAAATAIATAGTTANLLSNHVHTSAANGDNDLTLTLPAAVAGSYIVVRQITEAFDGADKSVIINCASGETFVAGQRLIAEGGGAHGTLSAASYSTGDAVVGTGSLATDNRFAVNNGGTDHFNWGSVGSAIYLYAPEDGKWLVNVHAVALNNGNVGSMTFSTV
jgi:hypothetical protein